MSKIIININKFLILALLVIIVSCSQSKERIEISDIARECDISIFHGLKPDMKKNDFFSVLGEPDYYYDGNNEDESHCPIYSFDNYILKCYWDGSYPEIGVIEFIPSQRGSYTIHEFLSEPEKYGITINTKRFDIYSNGVWWFAVFLDNYKVQKIQYWYE